MRTSILAAVIAASFAVNAFAAEATTPAQPAHPATKSTMLAQHTASTTPAAPAPMAQERATASESAKMASTDKSSLKAASKHHGKKSKAKAGKAPA